MENYIEDSLKRSYTYQEYRSLVTKLLKEGKSTGNEQSDDLLHYSELNETRMNRLDKTIAVPQNIQEGLAAIRKKYIWLVLSEGWCGDAAQILPILHKMDESAENITLQLVFRDENEELMQHFLTNGGRAIPKVIVLDADTKEILADWGPRPQGAKQLILDYKAAHGVVDETAKTDLQMWYLKDKGLSTQQELLGVMEGL
ncbi:MULTISPECIES: thioredoxin family protein [unclassified Flavobacterium]|uniref:thioredoxin family protein n=1 Tax=unclassified Flavobacterium TaxID=196869 RepID=UPI00086BFACA|nr:MULTISPECIES: thioredoxin family protein [unclassified Flavobacterium]MBN9283559.1 thioredoxin family protein [Flavobacterium sp.]ODS86490.1 MAG: thioredoxin [Chryseobacterium sp. SCN 40-13]OJV69327.1 MAG: thioredoxin family protein [Flavobacterium sp. 40-81]